MAIKIDLYSLEIPVEIGGLSFCTTMDDDSLLNMYNKLNELAKEAEQYELSNDNEDDFMFIRENLAKTYNTILGEDAFDKLYEKTHSTLLLYDAVFELADGLKEEYRAKKAKLIKDKPKYNQKHKRNKRNVQLNQ